MRLPYWTIFFSCLLALSLATALPASARILFWGISGNGAWETAGNWFDIGLAGPAATPPNAGDDCIVDGSVAAGVHIVTVSVVGQACRSLTIDASCTVDVVSGGLAMGDGLPLNEDLRILNGGRFLNDITTTGAATVVLVNPANDRMHIFPGGYSLFNSPRSFAVPFPAGSCLFDPGSTFEFGQSAGASISVANRTFGNLHLSATGPKTFLAAFGASSFFTVNDALRLTSANVTFELTMTNTSNTTTLKRIENVGGVLDFKTSTGALAITGDIVNTGTITTSATQPITFNGVTEITSTPTLVWNNGFILASGRQLALRSPIDWPALKVADIRGLLTLRSGGAVLKTVKYAAGSFLEYANPFGYNVSSEWAAGGAGTDGVPRQVTVSAGPVHMPGASRTVDGSIVLGASILELNVGGDLHVRGDWLQSAGTLTANGREVYFEGASDNAVSGPAKFDRVTVDKGGNRLDLPASLVNTFRAVQSLTLTSGRIRPAAPNFVSVDAGGGVSRTAGYVDGALRRTPNAGSGPLRFDVGTGATYSPATLTFSGADGLGNLTVFAASAVHGDIANSGIQPAKVLARTWSVVNAGAGFGSCTGLFEFVPGDITGGANPLAIVARKYDGTWSRPPVGPRTATSVEVPNLTSFSEFAFGEPVVRTITASAGTGGSIAPSGAVAVNDGDTPSFLSTPAANYVLSDVLVDAGSVGAIANYTFPVVTADHTIAASFLFIGSTVSAAPPAGCISLANPCRTVPVNIARTDSPNMRGYSVTLQLSPELELCSTPAASITQGTYLSAIGGTTLQVVANGGGSYTVDCAILGLPCGQTAASGNLFNVSVKKATGGPDGTGTVSITGVLARDCDNGALAAMPGASASVTIDTGAPGAIAALAAMQLKVGNDGDGTTKITLTWPAVEAGATVEVYRAKFGNYPEYDDPPTPGSAPSAPSYPPSGPWALTAVATSGGTDEVSVRDFWYYVAFVRDACGNVSAVSNRTNGTLNYHLGDVSNGFVAGTGNNLVDTADMSLLGANYGVVGAPVAAVAYLDVGPTTDFSTDARPTTDDKIGFEDLILFAINYGTVSAPSTIEDRSFAGTDELSVASVASGSTIEARIRLHGSGRIQGLSTRLSWNPRAVEPIGYEAGAMLSGANGVVFSPAPGTVDAALLGVRDIGLSGEGDVAAVRFRVLTAIDPEIAIAEVTARDAANQPVSLGGSVGTQDALPKATLLMPPAPNPTTRVSSLAFSLVHAGRVDLAIFSVDGRKVRTLVAENREAGFHSVSWNGMKDDGSRAAAGVYFARMLTSDGGKQTRVITVLGQ